jgi:uncharacterized membrane protein (UPF0127 family)
MVEPVASRVGPSIHMLFVRFPISATWMDSDFRVVDWVVARPWRPFYAPCKPARYTLEADPSLIDRIRVDDVLRYEEGSG